MDMLKQGEQKKTGDAVVQNLEDGIKRSLGLEKQRQHEQLLAAQRLHQQQQQQQQQQQRQQDNDLSAFKKLVGLFVGVLALYVMVVWFSFDFVFC